MTEKEIGQGNFGIVYHGESRGMVVAVKFNKAGEEDLRKEAAILKALGTHPNLLLYMCSGYFSVHGTSAFGISMEFAHFGALSTYITDQLALGMPLTQQDQIMAMLEIGSALYEHPLFFFLRNASSSSSSS